MKLKIWQKRIQRLKLNRIHCVIEIKPKKQTVEPKVQQRKTKGYIYEVTEWARNQTKWKVAEEFCQDRQWKFKILTEEDLGIK